MSSSWVRLHLLLYQNLQDIQVIMFPFDQDLYCVSCLPLLSVLFQLFCFSFKCILQGCLRKICKWREEQSQEKQRQPIKFHTGYKYRGALRIVQIMGKRAPKAEKAEKAETKKAEKKEEEVSAEDAHFEVFTPKFYQTLDSFKKFYIEVLTLKAKSSGDDSTGFGEVRKRVSGKLEAESSKILKEELSDLEKWIEQQQGKLAGETAKIEEAYKANSSSLASTGSFTDEEIRKQLQPIQAKIDEKNANHSSYGALLKRAHEIYE